MSSNRGRRTSSRRTTKTTAKLTKPKPKHVTFQVVESEPMELEAISSKTSSFAREDESKVENLDDNVAPTAKVVDLVSTFDPLTLMSKGPCVTLQTSDDLELKVSKEIAEVSLTLKNMLEDIPEPDAPIPLPSITFKMLVKIMEACQHIASLGLPPTNNYASLLLELEKIESEERNWFDDYCNVTDSELFDLITAANFLDIKIVLESACRTVAGMVANKSIEEIRKKFKLANDFTPEEEQEVLKQNAWIEQYGR